jgi:L-serine dehydratase
MSVSVFDMFTVGIGPSSSHTVGPMRAAGMLVTKLGDSGRLSQVESLQVELFGSLAATGRGHGTDKAVLMGLSGEHPELIDPDSVPGKIAEIESSHSLTLRCGIPDSQPPVQRTIPFDARTCLIWQLRNRLAYHPNALRFNVTFTDGCCEQFTYYSIGGGFVKSQDDIEHPTPPAVDPVRLPYPYRNGAELLERCEESGMGIPSILLANELALGRCQDVVFEKLLGLWQVMDECIKLGCRTEGVLPGGLGVRRRAPQMLRQLKHRQAHDDAMTALDWVSLYAMAVNEQNAAGGRVVTAPTNGAAGILPAVLKYATKLPGSDDTTIVEFLLAAGAIGAIYQGTASISGAEVGCQGEVGVASSMAAAGLAQILGGTPQQVANAAEIGLEHHLGLTCDPVKGLVQVPCIERNAIGANTAITAARLALVGDGRQLVTLDQVIATMMATGADMKTKYKETALGGLALSLAAC